MMSRKTATPMVLVLIASVIMSMVLTSSSSAQVAGSTNQASTAASAAAEKKTVVAKNAQGKVRSRISGETARGQRVSGSFIPLDFRRKAGNLKVRGLIQGVVNRPGKPDTTFTVIRTMRVQSINGTSTSGRSARAAAECDILNLVLGPLDLNLLGLEVSLNRVVLDIIGRTGAGNLLGNLLCAVAGLLDGGIGGALRRLVNLLNQILGALRLGI